MALTILLLLLFMAVLLAACWRNRYFLFFALLVLAAALSMLTLTVEIAKVSNYLVPANYLIRPIETRLYAALHEVAVLPLSTVMLLRNTGIAMYFGGIMLFVQSFSRSVRLDTVASRTPGTRLLRYVPMIALLALFFGFYHPQTAYRFYLLYHSGASHAESLLRTLDAVMRVCVLLYLLWPILFLVINHRKRRMTLFSGFLLRLTGALLVLNISFYMLFFTGVFSPSCDDALQYGFWRFTLPTTVPVFYTSVLPFLSFILIVTLFLMLMRLHADHLFSMHKFHGIRRNLNALYANVRNVMHSEKNLLFTIRILAQNALDAGDEGERKAKLEKILELCSTNMDDLTRTLNEARDMNMNAAQSDLVAAVDNAVAELHIPEGIRIERSYASETMPLFFDTYHMTHAIANVLSNSVDALATEAREDPVIRLELFASRGWVYFSVWDNGCGIPAAILRKVEQPYISTKKKKNSWGIGLSYVFSVVRAHYGQMRISSREHSYTKVEMLLPRAKKNSRR